MPAKARPARPPRAPHAPPTSVREALRLRGPTRRQLSRHQREQRRRRAIVIGGATLIAIVVGVLGFGYWRENIARGQETVAVVFGERIAADQLAEEIRPRLNSLDRRMTQLRASGMSQQATQLQLQRQRLPETVLNDLVEERVVRREAARRGIEVTPAEVEERVRQIIAETDAAAQPQPSPTPGSTASPDAAESTGPLTAPPTATPVPTLAEDRFGPALQAYLNQTGLTQAQLDGFVRSELYEDKLRTAIGEELPSVQEQVHARHIVFKEEAEAAAALEQMRGGASFEALAASQSQDEATKDKGGDLGWLPRMGRDAAFDEALFSLAPGQFSGPVQTLRGWEIIQVLERDPARLVDENQLSELRRRHYGDWLAAAVGSPEIERKLSPDISTWVLQRATPRQ
jgi:parvulin-like peptidyl-prolyl isomerase